MYWSTFCAVMVNSGFSLANGSERKPLLSTVPAFFGMGFQAGIEPSALPAISAPIGVRLLPSLSASAAGTAAMTPVASSESPRTPAWNRLLVIFMCMCSS
ncbi:hypothetical protein FQZ97_1181190 [compost metagenome]